MNVPTSGGPSGGTPSYTSLLVSVSLLLDESSRDRPASIVIPPGRSRPDLHPHTYYTPSLPTINVCWRVTPSRRGTRWSREKPACLCLAGVKRQRHLRLHTALTEPAPKQAIESRWPPTLAISWSTVKQMAVRIPPSSFAHKIVPGSGIHLGCCIPLPHHHHPVLPRLHYPR